ncbi:MAG: hypothetical protein ACD_24C00315G0002 [uncultured bacterium]|uniref:Glucokinase n=1 Tax=Candidatus Daviesbacteria bacterium RIFCSPHIGHO2_01_FULL_40_11 TaxID=1797762 RepID=A0A1F5JJH7_9BACT|nr:MAG: hypothetical protein ACD_24C00315G0002 [uncultured bacterium]OGE28801.1 MAG: hypothetical protein A2867_04235 [Candidatus Daviesbacteria bacterium RIFCSPHIGHO2_01_FULL_40_11]OGE62911.1 MAG: hypothetical protein A2964_01430 [Candidatus Daviesbacteria bacterium RIFCSPLOWO2_01_FULL_40_27]
MYLVFDIGGTHMRIGVSSDGSTITESKIVPTSQDFDQGILVLKQTADELSGGEKINVVAGGIPGPLDKGKSMLVTCPQLHGWIQKPLKAELEKAYGTKVYLENDTAIGGIGEAVKGAGAGKKIVAYLAMGTGIGGTRIVDQRVDSNNLGFEPGHQIIMPDGNPCNCGGKGHLEAYVGGSYIEKIYHQRAEDIKDVSIWNEVSKYLAIGLNNTIVHWSPDIVVLGGSVSESIPLEKVQAYLSEFLTIFPQAPDIVKASLGHDGGLYGALELLK